MKDGANATIFAVEAGPNKAVPWTKPDDLPFDPQQPNRMLGKLSGATFLALFADSGVREVPVNLPPDSLRALFTRAAGDTSRRRLKSK